MSDQEEQPKSNRPTKDFNEKYLERIDNLDAQLATEKGKYMKKCQDIKSDKAAVYDEYDVKGGAVKGMKHYIKVRNDFRKNVKNVDDKIGKVMGDEFRFLADQLNLYKPVMDEMGPSEYANVLAMMALEQDLGLKQSAIDNLPQDTKDALLSMLSAAGAKSVTDTAEVAKVEEEEVETETVDVVEEADAVIVDEETLIEEEAVHVEEEVIDADDVDGAELIDAPEGDPDGFTDATDEVTEAPTSGEEE